MRVKTLEDLENLNKKGLRSIWPDKTKITVGMATCGLATGAGEVFQTILEEVEKQKLDVIISKTGCIGFCQREPIVDVIQPGKPRILFQEMTAKKAKALVLALGNGDLKKEWALCKIISDGRSRELETEETKSIPLYEELDFYKKQEKIALRNCGFIDQDNIEEYIARGGYYSLHRVVTGMSPEGVIEEVIKSGLRGRGGAGFLTGRKWEFVRDSEEEEKFVVCNADEGDPGAYMDRSILEGDPHTVLEGMMIGGYAVGSSEGSIYVRDEYPLAIDKLKTAIEAAREYGLLGKNIFGSDFNFNITINRGAGAFVCGEETALITSLEGKMGEPRQRPPFPAKKGLWGKPTNINNVETWANIPEIIARGSDWYSKIGSKKSKGTKVFSLVGKVNNTGLVEVPMGITLREIIYNIGGGILHGKKFKAVQTGGPSGGCIPESQLDLQVDYEELTQTGSIMGSGGMIVMDENTCMVDMARYFLDFLKGESCGKCVACREGIERLLEILTDICEGKREEEDIMLLEELATVVKDFSLCGLGRTAPNPVLTTIRYFRDEYIAHIRDKVCPAGVCKELIHYSINEEKCNGCTACLKVCPSKAILGEKKKLHKIYDIKCIKCGACYESCKFDAVVII